MGEKLYRFLTRTWFYDRRKPIEGAGFAQTFIEIGETVPASAVIWGATDSGAEYVRRGYCQALEAGEKAPSIDAGKEG